jgi:hypothetical protein
MDLFIQYSVAAAGPILTAGRGKSLHSSFPRSFQISRPARLRFDTGRRGSIGRQHRHAHPEPTPSAKPST